MKRKFQQHVTLFLSVLFVLSAWPCMPVFCFSSVFFSSVLDVSNVCQVDLFFSSFLFWMIRRPRDMGNGSMGIYTKELAMHTLTLGRRQYGYPSATLIVVSCSAMVSLRKVNLMFISSKYLTSF